MITTIALTLALTSPCAKKVNRPAKPTAKEIEVAMMMSLAAKKVGKGDIKEQLNSTWNYDKRTGYYWRDKSTRHNLLKSSWLSPEPFPEGLERYIPTDVTQRVSILDGRYTILKVPLANLPEKWQVSGGMEGIEGWHSDKYRLIPEGTEVETWVGDVRVLTGNGFQVVKGIKRRYPVGTEFHDVLSNDEGETFEHRKVHKKIKNGKEVWIRDVLYVNEDARPQGYTKSNQSCASCHNQAGTGGYGGDGLIPGGDSILSDPLDWSVVEASNVQARTSRVEETTTPFIPQPRVLQFFNPPMMQQSFAPMISQPMQSFTPSFGGGGFSSGGAACST